ncbi:MAG TPA: hemolysin III family protein [Chthoniobacter sp.]|nr:hemolysin III family protein [Chthoniobacter sp.]
MPCREWSRSEELANSLSHGVGFLAAIIGTPFLLDAAEHHGGARAFLGMSVFAATSMMLYLSSAVHHWLRPGPAKDFFEVMDHAAIFLMIAGTYTPFALGFLWGPWGWLLMAIVWPLALFGVLIKSIRGLQPKIFVIPLYVLMGWTAVIAYKPFMAQMPSTGLLLLVAGGLAYTGGLVFYLARRFSYHHLAWHLAVLTGTVLHYFTVLHYALGPQ